MAPRAIVGRFSFFAGLFLVWIAVTVTSATYSDGEIGMRNSGGRSLLQSKKSCPINFEFMNYTIVTSQCKGPLYPAELCCKALKEFACPYADQLNDMTNDCGSTMFSYITLYGKYPQGLFASECKEAKEGLECPAPAPPPSNKNGSFNTRAPGFLAMLPLLLALALVLH